MARLGVEVALVYRSGGVYDGRDVAELVAQCRQHLPGLSVAVFADNPGKCECADRIIPLRHGWPGWWSKMELFDPGIPGDWLYFDLDTILTGNAMDFAATDAATIMADVYRPGGLQSSVMRIPPWAKPAVWERFTAHPQHHINRHKDGGDQEFIETVGLDWSLWQETLPGRLVSYKAHVLPNGGVPGGASVVVFHGRPKPRDLGYRL